MEIYVKNTISLPVTNENGSYEIRLESIGGLGANLCGKMLGELGALSLSLNSLSFSSYGSEKRGSPSMRMSAGCADDRPLRVNSPVTRPHLLRHLSRRTDRLLPGLGRRHRRHQNRIKYPLVR